MKYKGVKIDRAEFSSIKLEKLFAYLAYYHNSFISSNELVEELWGKWGH